jgi:hypothetical protein
VFKLRGQQGETKGQKMKQLWGKEFKIVKNGLDEEQVIDFVNELAVQQGTPSSASVSSIIKKAIKGAEQIIDSIQVRARAEAEEEAARIIVQAKQEAEAIRGGLKTKTEEEIEKDILSETDKKIAEKEYEASGEATEGLAEASVKELSEAVVATTQEAKLDQKEVIAGRRGQDKQSLYSGYVEIVIEVPINPNMVTKLYDYMYTTPEVKLISTSGSWNKGTTLAVNVDKPIPLISVLSSLLPDSEIKPVLPEKETASKITKAVGIISISQKGIQ